MAESKNHYQVLQVDPSAGQDIITAAYKQLAKTFHPDVNKSPEANRAMQRINIAYQILSDPLQRARYDRELQQQRENQAKPSENTDDRVRQTQEHSYPQDQPRHSDVRHSDVRYSDIKYPFQGADPGAPAGEVRTPEWLQRERNRTKHWRTNDNRYSRDRNREKPKGAIRWGWAVLYVILASVLFLIFGLQAKSIEGVIAFLVVALILSIPIVFRMDETLRK